MASLLEGFNFWKISENTIFGQEQYTVFNAEEVMAGTGYYQ